MVDQAAFAWIRSKRRRSTIFCRERLCCRSGTRGYNLGCKFCQNWDISKAREYDVLAERASPEDIAHKAEQLGCPSVAYTYNDPTIFHEDAIDTAIACHARGIKSIAVTAGYICAQPRAEFYRHIDAANIDLKGFSEEFYHKVCYAHLQPVLDTLVYVKRETQVWLEVTTLLIPGLNDSDAELETMTQWLSRISVRTCPGTSPPSIRTGVCGIFHARQARRSPAPERSQ